MHEDHGRIDNNCGGLSAVDINWNVALPIDYPGSRTVTFNAAGNGDVYNTNQTQCRAYTVNALGFVTQTASYTMTSYANTVAPYTNGPITVATNGGLGIQCFVPPAAATSAGGKLISFEYAP